MALNPLGNIIYINQNMQVAAAKQLDFQGRVEFQNLVAAAAANNKEEEIEDIMDINEDIMIKEDLEHYRENSDQTTGEKETEEKAIEKNAKKNKKSNQIGEEPHLLDIIV